MSIVIKNKDLALVKTIKGGVVEIKHTEIDSEYQGVQVGIDKVSVQGHWTFDSMVMLALIVYHRYLDEDLVLGVEVEKCLA